MVKLILKWIVAAVALWALLIACCFLYPSHLGYAGLAFLVLWYVYIPILFIVCRCCVAAPAEDRATPKDNR